MVCDPKAVTILVESQIPFRIDPSTGDLLVAADDMHTARIRLAQAGIPKDDSTGFELMDQDQSLGTSQFIESTRYHRATRNYELDRTISYTRYQQGTIDRLSVAVVVDDRVQTKAGGNEERVAWTPAPIRRPIRPSSDTRTCALSSSRG